MMTWFGRRRAWQRLYAANSSVLDARCPSGDSSGITRLSSARFRLRRRRAMRQTRTPAIPRASTISNGVLTAPTASDTRSHCEPSRYPAVIKTVFQTADPIGLPSSTATAWCPGRRDFESHAIRWRHDARSLLPRFGLMSLIALRAEIDAIDDQLVDLLAQRQQLVQGAAAFKRDADEVRGADRRRLIMERLRRRAADQGLDPQVVDAVWTAMIDVFVTLELSEHARQNG